MALKGFFRRRKLDRAATNLGVGLQERFGRRRYYAPADVYSTAALLGIGGGLLGYCLAFYCTRHDFEHATRNLGGQPEDYDAFRGEFSPLPGLGPYFDSGPGPAPVGAHSMDEQPWTNHGAGSDDHGSRFGGGGTESESGGGGPGDSSSDSGGGVGDSGSGGDGGGGDGGD